MLDGIITSGKAVQYENAYEFIYLTPSVIVRFVKLVQLVNE